MHNIQYLHYIGWYLRYILKRGVLQILPQFCKIKNKCLIVTVAVKSWLEVNYGFTGNNP